jgi:DNA-nicking Smr family endonuclease
MTGDDTRPRRRRLSEEEHVLWRGVTRSIAPLKRRHSSAALKAAPTAARPDAAAMSARAGALARGAPTSEQAAPRKIAPEQAIPKPAAPPLVPLDRQLKRRLGRGSEAVAARIDLHGLTQDRAHAALLQFLRRAQAEGTKTVLVITGKGAPGEPAGERGVLRRMVPHWLALPRFRAYVRGFEEAPIRHGGSGAVIVSVRRGRNH